MKYAYLFLAILSELVGAIATRQSAGFTKVVPTIIATAGVILAYYMLSLTLKEGMSLGVAYGIWAALGITSVAIIGYLFFDDHISNLQITGIVLIVGGVLALELG